jgi:MFS family permease
MWGDVMLLAKRQRIYYGWIVAVCCSLLAFSVNAMGNNSLSFYVVPLSRAFGTSRALLNFCLFTVGAITRTLVGFVYGNLVKKFGVKPLMVAGVALAVGAYLLFSSAAGIVTIALGSGMYGIAHSIGTFNAYNSIINNWFIHKRGRVLGIVNVSVGLGGMVINPLAGNWIASLGWNASFLFTAMLIAAIAIPAVILVRVSPAKMGLEPLGFGTDSAPAVANEADKLSLQGAMRTLRFWMIASVQFCIGFAITQGFASIIPHLNNAGVNSALIANVLSIVLAAGAAVGAFTSGLVYDRFGLRTLFITIGSIQMAGIVIAGVLNAATPVVLLALSVFCIGYGNSLSLGTLPHMINHAFGYGRTNFGALFGWLFAISNAGNILGSPFVGMLFDRLGSYRGSYILAAVILLAVLVLVQLIIAQGQRVAKQREAAQKKDEAERVG